MEKCNAKEVRYGSKKVKHRAKKKNTRLRR